MPTWLIPIAEFFLKMLSSWKVALGVVVAIAGIYVWYQIASYQNLKEELERSERDKQRLELEMLEYRKKIDQIFAAKETVEAVKEKQKFEIEQLREKLNRPGKTDFGKLIEKKPKTVEKAIQKGSITAFESLEIASGAK